MSTTTSARRTSTSALAALAVALLAAPVRADVLHVPKDFPTIQEAVDAALAGDEIVVAAGTYTGTVDITGKTDVTLRGQGKVKLVSGELPTPVVLISGSEGVHVEHVRIEGAPGEGLRIFESALALVSHCRIENPVGVGIAVVDSDFVLIEHLVVTGAGDDGLHAENSNSLFVSHCTILDGAGDGIEIVDGFDVVVEHVTVERAQAVGIRMVPNIDNLDGGILRKCVVRDSGDSGLEVNGEGMLVEDNRVLDAGNVGLQIQAGDACIARDNRLIRPASRGLLISSGVHQVLDNRIVKPVLAGIHVSDSGLQVVSGNRVLKSLAEGIVITSGSNGCTLADNKVKSPVGDGIVVSADDTHVTDNRVQGAGDDGFEVVGASCIFIGNKGKGSAGFDLLDPSGNGNVYVDNDFGTTHVE